MKLTTIGLDLAKTVFQVHVAYERGKTVLKKQPKRAQVVTFFGNLTPCRIGMEACVGTHYLARKLMAGGHEVVLIPPQYVKPFAKHNKNDATVAEAFCEAVTFGLRASSARRAAPPGQPRTAPVLTRR